MKIYYSAQEAYPTFRVDLTELFFNELSALGLNVTWFMNAGKLDYPCPSNVILPPVMPFGGALAKLINKFMYIGTDILNLVKLLFNSECQLIQVRDKYIAALVAIMIAKIKGIPFVYWCSYPYPEHEIMMAKQSSSWLRRMMFLIRGKFGNLALYKIVMPHADFNFVQSEQMIKDVAAYGVPEKTMMAVPMGVGSSLFETINKLEQLEVDDNSFVYLGTLASVRKMDTIIRAFASVAHKHPQARLTMVGDGDFPFERQALAELSQQLGLQDSVIFTGFIPMVEAWEIVNRSAICLSPFYPSQVLASASPTKLVEYMALGKPVIVNDHPEQSLVIQDSGAGLCVEWGEDTFAEAMLWMLENPQAAKAMGAKGPDWVRKHRVYDIIAQQVYSKYVEIIGAAA